MIGGEVIGGEVIGGEVMSFDTVRRLDLDMLFMVAWKFCKQRFSIFDVLPVFGVEFYRNNTTCGYMINDFISKFIHKVTDAVIMTKDDRRIKTIVEGLYRFD